MARKFPERKFQCNNCDQGFTTNQHFKTHKENMHSPIQKIEQVCGVCNFSTNSDSSFKRHMKETHRANHDRLACNICGKTVKSQDALKAHKNTIHTAGVSFECDVCNHQAKSSQNLADHKKRHDPKTNCPRCDKKLSARSLNMHINKQHL